MSDVQQSASGATNAAEIGRDVSGEIASIAGELTEMKERVSANDKKWQTQYEGLKATIASLAQMKIAARITQTASFQDDVRRQQARMAKALEELIGAATLEMHTPAGVVPDRGRIVSKRKPQGGPFVRSFNAVLVWIARIFAVLFWAVFGSYICAGVLVRSFLSYSAALTASMFSSIGMAKAQQRLLWAVGLYSNGFVKIGESFTKPAIPKPDETSAETWGVFKTLLWEFTKSTGTYAAVYVLLWLAPAWVRDIVAGVASLF